MPIKLGDTNLYNIKELSEKLKVTPLTLRRYIKTGKLSGKKLGGKYMVTEESLRKYFEDGTNAQ
ncbi:MAG: Helix-turn-helix domain protein [Firmicutes bacterium ADurb.Bin099]|nr:MAG: Helix-turn-helix domain protein [Firmicutes bacterium ADurb.Bin099]